MNRTSFAPRPRHTATLLAAACLTMPAFAASDWNMDATLGLADFRDARKLELVPNPPRGLGQGIALAIGVDTTPEATATLRYPVTPTPNLLSAGLGLELAASYVDNGGHARVIVKLVQTNLATLRQTALLTLDSDSFAVPSFPAQLFNQRHSVTDGCNNTRLNFAENTYHIEATLSRVSLAGVPRLKWVALSQMEVC